VLEQHGAKLGRDNPNVDPLGYYDLFVGQLAKLYYGIPDLKQKIPGDDNDQKQIITPIPHC
jgi:molybdate/tungstate transport system substrate-binding protein